MTFPVAVAVPEFNTVEYTTFEVEPSFQLIVVTVFAGLLGIVRVAQELGVLPLDVVVPGELLVIAGMLLCVHPDNVRVIVSVCFAGVGLTPGETVAVPDRSHKIDGGGPFAAAADEDPTTMLKGSTQTTIVNGVQRRAFTKTTSLVANGCLLPVSAEVSQRPGQVGW